MGSFKAIADPCQTVMWDSYLLKPPPPFLSPVLLHGIILREWIRVWGYAALIFVPTLFPVLTPTLGLFIMANLDLIKKACNSRQLNIVQEADFGHVGREI